MTSLSLGACQTVILRSNLPEQILMNASRSLCAGFMLACILNTNAENFSSSGSMIPSLESLGAGGGASLKYSSKKFCTPKFVIAEPKNVGVNSPASILFLSKTSPASSSNNKSSWSASKFSCPILFITSGSSGEKISEALSFCPCVVSSAKSSI